MMHIQIIEDESLASYADFEGAEVWLLTQARPDAACDSRLVVEEDIAQSLEPLAHKLPQLMTRIIDRHPMDACAEAPEMPFTYEVITRDKDHYAVHAYVCDEDCIKTVTVPQDK